MRILIGTFFAILLLLTINACASPAPTPIATIPLIPTSTLTPSPTSTFTPIRPTATNTENPYSFQVVDIAFADAFHGWALSSYRSANDVGTLAMRVTSDGGVTWKKLPAPSTKIAPIGDNSSSQPVSQLRFANLEDGWAFGPGLYSTHDGGMTWIAEPHDGDIVALEPAGGSVWAFARSACSNYDGSPLCSFVLLVYNDTDQKFKPATIQPLMRGYDVQLVPTDARTAWVYSQFQSFDKQTSTIPTIGTLIVTDDGSKTWQNITNLPKQLLMGCRFTVGGSQLWLLCGGQPATAMQDKTLYKSTDRGKRWETVASHLPSIGHIRDFLVTAPNRAFIALNRGTLFRSNDGGQTWSDVFGGINELFFSRIVFVDMLHGWVFADGAGSETIYHTADGGTTWQNVVIQ